ncbi:MAG TPA: MFS transporter [Terriglobales bacterium]|nr:MFS transporter [Terriglobales bacterium]
MTRAAAGVEAVALPAGTRSDRYKWLALSNTTVGVVLATIDSSIMLIAMPDIFRGIQLDPLLPSNSFFLLWLILGYLVVSSVLVVSLGRIGDIFGRVRIYNLGFVVYTAASLLLTIDWMTGRAGASWLLVMRVVQGIGAACLVANSAAILTDAFPSHQRGLALGINNVAGISGMFIGLVLGGVLAPINWRLVFLVSVPFGLFGTVWAYLNLQDRGVRTPAPIDWAGNLLFAAGMVLVMIGVTYGIQPYGDSSLGWQNPFVIAALAGGAGCLLAFVVLETRVANPMFRISLFAIRAFAFGSLSTFLAAVARGGLMFMMIIWLQGIWLPEHGYSFESTPLWAGIFMLPLSAGFLLAGPLSGFLSDRFGSRLFATGGMLAAATTFILLESLPIDFDYRAFAAILLLNGLAMGAFAAPNRAGIMNSLPREHRGAGGGMNSTLQNSAQVFSIGIFFSLMIAGLSSTLPHAVATGLQQGGVPAAAADRIASAPPISILFAAFLGYNPIQHLLGPAVLAQLPPAAAAQLTGREFFSKLIAGPFHSGLHEAFTFAIAACLVAAVASWSRGGARSARALERVEPAGEPATGVADS